MTVTGDQFRRGHAARLAGIAAIAVAGLATALPLPAAAASSPPPAQHPVNPHTGLRPGVTPKLNPNRTPTSQAAVNAHLTYYGGHVISNVQVIQVLYGSGTYETEVQSTSTPSIASFYAGVTNSTYFDWLTEYNTTINAANGQAGTNQTIGRGSFSRQVQISPASSRNGSTIDDTAIQAELKAQVAAGVLPAPSANTLYAVYFPHGKTITQGGQSSGVNFCAYHGTTSSPEFYYSVLPDFTTGGMSSGCGGGSEYQNVTSVSSHELVESVTDAEVGLATNNAPPLAWYDSANGEIGDICNGQQAQITGGDGQTYTVQRQWSNRQGACVVSGPAQTNDFSISVAPSSISVQPGGSGSATVSTAVTSGTAGTVALSATGAPSGASVSFNPSSVTAGATSSVGVSTTSSVAPGAYPITIKGTEGSATHSTTLTLNVGSSGGGSGLVNGGFESGNLSGWTSSGSTSVVSSGAQSGTYAVRVGSTSPSTDSSISQTFTVPSGGTGVQFSYNVFCPDTVTYDWATATLKDNSTGTTTTVLPKTCVNPSSGWRTVNATATAGHSVTLTLSSHDDNYAGDPTYTLYDSVAVTSSSGGGGGGGGVSNGGFETGSFSGWTTSGAHTAITTTSHSGSYAAMAGNTTATNGDSTITQSFTAPSGTSRLNLYYANKCPDTVTYDWVTVTLKDNTTGTTATVVAKTCAASYVWTAAGAAVTPGDSYTLALTSHDDNYRSDPTYTLFDDVTLS